MFSVYRCVKDCGEVYRYWVATFASETKADAYAEAEEKSDVNGVFYMVEMAQ
jgi:hypothetical protein